MYASRSRWLAVAVVSIAAQVTAAPPGLGPINKARVMVIFDNSRSMQATLADDYDLSFRDHRLTPAMMTPMADGTLKCDETSPTIVNQCKNKFCVGQCVMHNAFDRVSQDVDIGFATYNQYYTKYTTKVANASASGTQCYYDVIAGPGELPRGGVYRGNSTSNADLLVSKLDNLGVAGNCRITEVNTTGSTPVATTNAAARHSLMLGANWFQNQPYRITEFRCLNQAASGAIPATNESAKTCLPDLAFNPNDWVTGVNVVTAGSGRVDMALRAIRNSNENITTGGQLTPTPFRPARYLACRNDMATNCGSKPFMAENFTPSTGQSSALFDTAYAGWLNPSQPQTASADERADGFTWYLFRTWVYPDPQAPGFVAGATGDFTQIESTVPVGSSCPAAGTTARVTVGNGGNFLVGGVTHTAASAAWSNMRCSANDPCQVTYVQERPGVASMTGQTWYEDKGASYTAGALTYNRNAGQPGGSSLQYGTTQATPPACPATVSDVTSGYGCSAGNPCDLTNGVVNTVPQSPDTSKFSFNGAGPFTSAGLTYSSTGTTNVSAGQTVVSGSTLGSCPAAPPSPTVSCSDPNNLSGSCAFVLDTATSSISASEPRFATCRYYVVRHSLSAPRPDQYRCQYTRWTWAYTANTTTVGACQWQIQRYEWRPRIWRYSWRTAGGELIDSQQIVTVPAAVNHCAAGTFPAECPTKLVAGAPGTPAECNVAGRECRLRWSTNVGAGMFNVSRGRQRNAGSSNGTSPTTSDRYCRMIDYQDAPLATTPQPVSAYPLTAWGSGGWCSGWTGQTDQFRDTIVITSDPFSPGTASSPNNVAGASYGVGQVLPIGMGRALTSVAHGLDPSALTNWTSAVNNGLPWTAKVVGWSRLPNGQPLLSAGDWGDPGVASGVPLFRPLPNPSGTPATVPTTVDQIRDSVLAMSMPSVGFAQLASTPTGMPTLPVSCTNGYRDPGERFVDCGGGGCPRCPVTSTTCSTDSDCPSISGVGYGVCDKGTFGTPGADRCVDETQLTALTGHNTPLFGALSNMKSYLQDELVDPDARCRGYGVVLVTDGLENQPPSQPQHPTQSGYPDYNVATDFINGPLANVVRDIKSTQIKTDTTGSNRIAPDQGIATFVVGFGSAAASDPNLDAMAQVGKHPSLSGYQVYRADSPALLRSQLEDIFRIYTARTYARSRPMIARDSTGSRFYIAYHTVQTNSPERLGFMDAYDSSEITAPTCPTPPCPAWKFNEVLDSQSSGSRRTWVVYGRSTSGGTSTFAHQTAFTTPLASPLNVGSAQRSTLMTEMGIGSDADFAATMAFIRNDSKSEPFDLPPALATDKLSRLSDINHSSPALIGPPNADDTWPAEDTEKPAYIAFKGANTSRPSRIFVGSNTGLVHAVCERTGATTDCGPSAPAVRGTEVYSVIPPSVLPTLRSTRNGAQSTADGSFGAADLCFAADCTNPSNWMTFLLGGMRAGSKALLAMNVSNPNQPSVLFEFAIAALGQTWSPPVVGRSSYSNSASAGNRWLAVLGGGYEGDQSLRTTANSAVVLDLKDQTLARDTAAVSASFRVDTNPPICDTLPPTDPTCPLPRNNVPARMAVTRTGKSAALRNAYFGDTQGRSWVMRIGGNTSVANWAPRPFFDPHQAPCAVNIDPAVVNTPILDSMAETSVSPVDTLPLDDFGLATPRPIFQQALVSVDADGRVMTFFGTGDELNDSSVHPSPSPAELADVRNYDYFFAVRDEGAGSGVCEGRPAWARRFQLDEKMLSLGTLGGAVVFVPVYVPVVGGVCGANSNSRIYAFYSANGTAAPVFDDASGVAGAPRRHYSDCIGCGRITDLQFVQNPNNRNQGTLFFGRESGRPETRGATGIAAGAKVKSFKRVR